MKKIEHSTSIHGAALYFPLTRAFNIKYSFHGISCPSSYLHNAILSQVSDQVNYPNQIFTCSGQVQIFCEISPLNINRYINQVFILIYQHNRDNMQSVD